MVKKIVNTLSVLLQEVQYVMNKVLPRDDIHTPLSMPLLLTMFLTDIHKILLVRKPLQSLQGK